MTMHLGMVRPGSTIYIPFATYAGATGASVTLTGLAVTDIEIYSNGSVTQRASDAGYTLLDTDGIDFDGITGIHGFSINLADNTTSGFYVAGNVYWVVVSSVTIDSQTVNFVAATFTIGYPDATLNTTIATLSTQTSFTLTAGPAEDDALNGCVVVIHDIASAVQLGHAIVSDYTGSTRTVTLIAGVTFTAAAGDNISVFKPALQPTVWGRTLDVSAAGEAGLDWANIGSPTTAQNLSATNIDVDQVVASVSGAVGSVTGNVGGNVTGSVGSVATGGITAASIATGAIDADAVAADAVTEIQSGLATAANLATVAGYLDTEIAAILADTNELQTDWANGGRLDLILDARASQTSVDTIDDFLDTEIAAIITTLGTPAGASISADIAAIEAQTDDIGAAGAGLTAVPWNAAWDAEVQSEVADALTAFGASTLTAAQVNAEVDTALADVNLDHLVGTATAIPAIPAGTYIDQIMDDGTATYDRTTDSLQAIRDRGDAAWDTADVSGLATAAALATVQADTDDIQTRLPAALTGGRMDASVGAYQTGLTPLQPTVAGRTLDVSATGEAGLDWANVGSPTTAVNLSGTNIDPDQVVASVTGAVGSVTAGVTVTTNNDKTGYALTSGERTSIATALLVLDLSTVSGEAARSVLNALRALRNRVAVAGGTMTVYEEDDATTAWTAAVTTDAAADPVTQVDPT